MAIVNGVFALRAEARISLPEGGWVCADRVTEQHISRPPGDPVGPLNVEITVDAGVTSTLPFVDGEVRGKFC